MRYYSAQRHRLLGQLDAVQHNSCTAPVQNEKNDLHRVRYAGLADPSSSAPHRPAAPPAQSRLLSIGFRRNARVTIARGHTLP